MQLARRKIKAHRATAASAENGKSSKAGYLNIGGLGTYEDPCPKPPAHQTVYIHASMKAVIHFLLSACTEVAGSLKTRRRSG